jgi:hypothetical protein
LPLVFLFSLPEVDLAYFWVLLPFAVPTWLNLLAIRGLRLSHKNPSLLLVAALALQIGLYLACLAFMLATAVFFSIWVSAPWTVAILVACFTVLLITTVLTLRATT